MNRRNLLTRGIIGAMTIALPLVPEALPSAFCCCPPLVSSGVPLGRCSHWLPDLPGPVGW